MRLTTIWNPTFNFSMRERLNRTGEWAAIQTASHLPKKIRYWAFILEGSHLMDTNEVVGEVRFMDLLARYEKANH